MIKQAINFSSNGQTYSVGGNDIFMDNGAIIAYIKDGKYSNPTATRVTVSAKEWDRIRPDLNKIDYEGYYGRAPLMKGISIYKIK